MTVDAFEFAADLLDPLPWEPPGRAPLLPHQVPPDPPWDLWLIEAGRGSGKTEACSRYYAKWMRGHPGARGRIIAPTFGDAVESCVTGPSGLQAVDDEVTWHATDPGGAKIRWPNGAEALVFGTPTPRDVDRFRAGGNRSIDWWEELAANPMIAAADPVQNAWDQAQLGLRLGDHPHAVASTTPRNVAKYRHIRGLSSTRLTRATLHDNPHTSPEWRAKMDAAYRGTRLGRQEIGGELLEDVEGALWTPALLDRCRVPTAPDRLLRVVVAVDPSGGGRDEQGIIAAGTDAQGHGYVLADRSCRLSPDGWGRRAIQLFLDVRADAVLWEANYGGDMVQSTIVAAAKAMGVTKPPTRKVVASRGKALRAQPVAALYGDPDDLDGSMARVHHPQDVDLARLEDQMTQWTAESGESPDRLDSLTMCLTDLMIARPGGPARSRRPSGRVPSIGNR